MGTERNSGTTPATTRHGRDRLALWLRDRRHVVVILALPLLLGGCNPFAERPEQMPVSNYTDKDIVIVHRDDDGHEDVLNDPDHKTTIEAWDGSGEHGRMMVIIDSSWCSHGSFIARTTDGVEVARKAWAAGFNICGRWTIGTPPPSASPSPSPSPAKGATPSPAPT
jgi:hypothetical protein